jgi:hypothetical protein
MGGDDMGDIHATKSLHTLVLNPATWLHPEKLERHGKEWHGLVVDSTVSGIIIHEMGHILANRILQKLGTDEYNKIRFKHLKDPRSIDMTEAPSVYGQEHSSEFEAEAFVAMVRDRAVPSGFAEAALRTSKDFWADMLSASRHTQKSVKPYGHTAYTRTTKTGKVVQVQAKGVKPGKAAGWTARGWWKRYGLKANPGWSGEFVDTTSADPARYTSEGANKASAHLMRMRELRSSGKLPKSVIDAICLFAITSIRTTAKAQAKVWPKIDEWLAGSERSPEKLLDIMRPLGNYNIRLQSYQRGQAFHDSLIKGMSQFGDDGAGLREWLLQQPETKNSGVSRTKVSFILELLGYDVACIDARLLKHLTGAHTENATKKLSTSIARHADLYQHFEAALRQSQAYKDSDPEPIRTAVAQWRMWNVEGGSDDDHRVLWATVARLTGVGDFAKAIGASSSAGLLSAALAYSYDRFGAGAPASYDVIPVLSRMSRLEVAKSIALPVLAKSVTHERFYTTVMTMAGKVKKIGEGKSGARQVIFDNGVKATLKPKLFSTGTFRGISKDTQHLREAAAYQLDRQVLHLDVVPPTALTMYEDSPASIQAWVVGVPATGVVQHVFNKKIDGQKDRLALFAAKVDTDWLRRIVLFDLIVNNVDRHAKNCLFDPFTKKVWAIDHGLCFGRYFQYYNNVFHRGMFRNRLELRPEERSRLEAITLAQLTKALQRYLPSQEIEETYWRIRWILAQPNLGYVALAPESTSKNDFPAHKAWFVQNMKKEPRNRVLAQLSRMGGQA